MAFKYSTAEAVYPIILGCVCGIVFCQPWEYTFLRQGRKISAAGLGHRCTPGKRGLTTTSSWAKKNPKPSLHIPLFLLPHCCEARGPVRTATVRCFWFVAPRVKAMIA